MSFLLGTTTTNPLFGGLGFGRSPSLLDLYATPPQETQGRQWTYVADRFSRFIDNLAITESQRVDGETKQAGIRACLNRVYYGYSSATANSFLMGSWGKTTRVRPSRDIDILFLLPPDVYHRYQLRSGNKQSQLLQEIKGVLEATYPLTAMRGDGQVVTVPFNSMPVEISPGFLCNDGSIIVCDTNNGGRYIASTAAAEAAALDASDQPTNGNARRLARMMKQWQRHSNVPIKSFQLERLACEFLSNYANAKQGYFFYDWLVRDFFAYLTTRANTYLGMPGSGERVWLGNEWVTRAQTAYRNAVVACDYERTNNNALAGLYWRDIFGMMIPSEV